MRNLLLLAGFFCLILAWLEPNHYLPWTTFRNDFLAWLSLIFVASSVLLGKLQLKLPKFAVCILLLSAYPALQFTAGHIFFFGDMLLASSYLFGFGFAVALAYAAAEKEKRFVDMLAIAFVSGALISFLIALCQWLSLDLLGLWAFGLPKGSRPYGNLAQPNNLATLFLAGIAAGLYLRISGRWGALFSSLLIMLLLVGVAMTQSRTALVAFAVLLSWLMLVRSRLNCEMSRGEVICGGLLGFSLWFAWPILSDLLYLSAQGALDRMTSVGSDARIVMWTQLLDAAWQRPLTGWGWNQVSVAQVEVAEKYPRSSFAEHSHNLFIDLMVWNGGVVGLLLSVALCAWILRRLWQVKCLHGWYAMASIMILGVHAMFEFPLDYAFFLIPMGFFVGVVEVSVGERVVLQFSNYSHGLVLLVGGSLLVMILMEYLVVEEDYRRLRFESMGIERRSLIHMAPDVTLLTQSREFLRFARTEARPNMHDDEIEWMRQVSSRYAYPPAMFRYAVALGLNQQYDAASIQLLRLRQLHPEIRFREAKEGWKAMEQTHPELARVRPQDMAANNPR